MSLPLKKIASWNDEKQQKRLELLAEAKTALLQNRLLQSKFCMSRIVDLIDTNQKGLLLGFNCNIFHMNSLAKLYNWVEKNHYPAFADITLALVADPFPVNGPTQQIHLYIRRNPIDMMESFTTQTLRDRIKNTTTFPRDVTVRVDLYQRNSFGQSMWGIHLANWESLIKNQKTVLPLLLETVLTAFLNP